MRKYNVLDLVVPAWLHTKKVFGKSLFNIKKWFFYAFLVLMSSSALGFNINYNNLINGTNGNTPTGAPSPSAKLIGELLQNNIVSQNTLVLLGIIFIVLGLAFYFVWTYLYCNFTYILNDSVLLNKTDIKELWEKNNKKSKSYFSLIMKLVIYIIAIMIVIGLIFALVFSRSCKAGHSVPDFMVFASQMVIFLIIFLLALGCLFIYLTFICNCVIPLHLKMDEDVSIIDASKTIFNLLKKDWKKAFIALIAIALAYGTFCFIFGMGATLFNLFGIFSLLSLSTEQFLVVLTLVFLIYSAIVIFLNAPVAVFITSYRFLVLSHLWPEYALLLPVQDEKGKFIGTMSYFEHLEQEQVNSDTENFETYPNI